MLQNSSRVTPEQKDMSERILSEIVFQLSVGHAGLRASIFSAVAQMIYFTVALWLCEMKLDSTFELLLKRV